MSHQTSRSLERRRILKGAVAVGAASLVLGPAAGRALATAPARPTKLKLAWLPGAICVAPLPLAVQQGIFAKHGLDVELQAHAFHDEAFLASPTNGQADAAATMIHNWLPPMQKGLKVKILTSVHGGCIEVLGSRRAGVTSLAKLKGKTIAVGGPPELAKTVYSIILNRNGLDPNKDVSWVQVKDDDLGAAFETGKAQAVGGLGPHAEGLREKFPDLVQIASNQTGPMTATTCCVVAAGESLWRDRPLAAAALAAALNEASDYAAAHPEEAAAAFAESSPYPARHVLAAEKTTGYHVHPTNRNLRRDILAYTEDLKAIGVFPASLDAEAFADQAFVPVICG